MFTVKFQSYYLLFLLPPSKLLKQEKFQSSLFIEWIKIILKNIKMNRYTEQTTGPTLAIN